MASLLLHSEVIPARARDAIKAAHHARADRRGEMLESAARALYAEADIDCRDARELVDLPPEGCCS